MIYEGTRLKSFEEIYKTKIQVENDLVILKVPVSK